MSNLICNECSVSGAHPSFVTEGDLEKHREDAHGQARVRPVPESTEKAVDGKLDESAARLQDRHRRR